MTKDEFRDSMYCPSDLVRFCEENGFEGVLEDWISDNDRDEAINEAVAETYLAWYDLNNVLNDIPTGYDYYIQYNSLEYEAVDDYVLADYIEKVINQAPEDFWTDEESNTDAEVPQPVAIEEEFIEELPELEYDFEQAMTEIQAEYEVCEEIRHRIDLPPFEDAIDIDVTEEFENLTESVQEPVFASSIEDYLF